jgi:GT2 family glycosyltransferase
MTQPKVFILILNYNGKETLKQCLQSVYQLNYSDFEVVLIDNDSKDGSLEEVKYIYPRAHFIKNNVNLGFAAGNNVGIRFALEKGADYVWLVNNDAKVEKDSLAKLIDAGGQKPKSGILSPLIMHDKTKNIWFGKGVIDWVSMKTLHVSPPTLLQSFTSEYICGCAMLIKKEVFKKIGLLNEKYFLYYEDADFSIKATRAGFELWTIPTAHVLHSEASESNPEKTYWLVISGLQFFHENTPVHLKPWMTLYFLARRIKNYFDCASGKNLVAKEVARAYRDYSASV